LEERFRYEPTGLSLPRPYVRGKMPVVFVHGLWASPSWWRRMIEALAAEGRVSATAVQTVGKKGYDGFLLARVEGASSESFASGPGRRPPSRGAQHR
jgi:pimeloyl-ACP methyl ester carboxylesterase